MYKVCIGWTRKHAHSVYIHTHTRSASERSLWLQWELGCAAKEIPAALRQGFSSLQTLPESLVGAAAEGEHSRADTETARIEKREEANA